MQVNVLFVYTVEGLRVQRSTEQPECENGGAHPRAAERALRRARQVRLAANVSAGNYVVAAASRAEGEQHVVSNWGRFGS